MKVTRENTKILHYAEKSFMGKPSFIIQNEGVKYLSNGDTFIEGTEENISKLINKHRWGNYIDELFRSPCLDFANLTDGYSMFEGTQLSSFEVALPNLTDGRYMFYGTPLSSFEVALPKLTYGSSMFEGTQLSSFEVALPNLTDGYSMFYGTPLSSFEVALPNLTDGRYMFKN